MLLYAAILLDSVVSWYGAKYDEDQAMECPRTTFIDPEAIPKQIKYAQIELALHLITNGASFTPDNSIDKLEVGPISIDFNQPTGETSTMLPPIVQTMLAQYGSVRRSGNSANTVGLVRV